MKRASLTKRGLVGGTGDTLLAIAQRNAKAAICAKLMKPSAMSPDNSFKAILNSSEGMVEPYATDSEALSTHEF